jgi:hypothetical protein
MTQINEIASKYRIEPRTFTTKSGFSLYFFVLGFSGTFFLETILSTEAQIFRYFVERI